MPEEFEDEEKIIKQGRHKDGWYHESFDEDCQEC